MQANNKDKNPYQGPHVLMPIPNHLTGLVIGKNGETIKLLHNRTGANIFIPKTCDPCTQKRVLEISGSEVQIE